MAYDPVRRVYVLFGGQTAHGTTDETSTFDGKRWRLMSPAHRPAPRRSPAMARDPARAVVMLYGGIVPDQSEGMDVGDTWVQFDRAPRLPGRGAAEAAWDPAASALVVAGGVGLNPQAGPGAQGMPLNDAWSLSDSGWKTIAPGPATLSFVNAFWDASGGRVIVMLGMQCPSPTDRTWAWDGSSWTALGSTGVGARWGAALAEAPGGSALVFGGSNEAGC